MKAFHRHLRLFLTLSLVLGGQSETQGIVPDRLYYVICPYILEKQHQDREAERAAGTLRGPENLFENVTMAIARKVDRLLPATRGEVQDAKAELTRYKNDSATQSNALEQFKSETTAENSALEQYKSESTAEINALVDKLNTLTPVRTPLVTHYRIRHAQQISLRL